MSRTTPFRLADGGSTGFGPSAGGAGPTRWRRFRAWGDRAAVPLLLAGVTTVVLYNLSRWRRDRALAEELRKAREAPLPPLGETPRVTILVAAWNEAHLIGRHIERVLALRYPNLEYIVCAGGKDGTLEQARAYERPGVVVLEQKAGEGKQRTLRRALPYATGEIIYLTDADCLVDDRSFERTVRPIIEEGEVASTGGSRPLPEQIASSPLAALQYLREAYLSLYAGRDSPGLLGRNCAVRRDALLATGGFAMEAPTGTDYRLARNLLLAGYRIRLVPDSEIVTSYATGPRQYARQQSRWLRNLVVHGLPTRDRTQVRAAVTSVLAGFALLSGPLVRRMGWRLAHAVWELLLLHALISRVRQSFVAARLADCRLSPGAIAVVPLWLALDALIWSSMPLQLLSRKWRARW